MWTFKPGYLGACILAVAILGGILAGSLANVSTHTEQTTRYDYHTDITGLFDSSDEPQYINFNPATNYTGYTNTATDPNNPSGLSYTATSTANNYRIPLTSPVTSTGPSGTTNNSTNITQTSFSPEPHIPNVASTDKVHSNALFAYTYGFKVASVYDWAVRTFGDLGNYTRIDLTITAPANHAPTNKGVFGAQPFAYDEYTAMSGGSTSGTFTIWPADKTYTETIGTQTFTYSMFERYVCYGDATQYEYWYSGGWNSDNYSTSLSFNYTSTVTTVPEYAYILPDKGVSLSSSSVSTIWDNDTTTTQYDNVNVGVLVGPKFQDGTFNLVNGQITIAGADSDDPLEGTWRATVGYSGDTWGLTLRGYYGDTMVINNNFNLGSFRAVLLVFDGQNHKLNVYGVTSFNNYQDISYSPTPLVSTACGMALDNLTFSSITPNVPNWSVYSTKVFMDTYDTVLVDPSINLADYWPDMNSYRFAFQSFALYGDSITINNATYPVTNESIVINDKAYKLDNFFISFSEQGDTSITFNKVNRTVDLGPTVDKVVSFAGNWGFTAGLYEGHTDTKDVYDWDIKLLGDNINTIVLLTLGLGVVACLVCKWLGVKLRMTDFMVLGGGALVLFMFLVV